MYEIYWNQYCTMLMVENLETSDVKRLDEISQAYLQQFDLVIADSRPEIYKNLCDACGHGPQFAYSRIFTFSACNFSTRDGRPDINEDFVLITERVSCPMRHRCNLGYCKFESELSNRELQVVKLFAVGFNESNIADQLFISKSTVHNHITNIYTKLGLSGSAHPDRLLISYAYNNKLI